MIQVIVDSVAALPEHLVNRHNFRIVPLYVRFGEASFRDGVDLTPEAFFRRLPESPVLPTTSQPSPGDFLVAYEEVAKRPGATGIAVITMSGALSGTYLSAHQAAQQFDQLPVAVYDSRSVAMAEGFCAIAAAKAAERGADLQQVIAAAQAVGQSVQLYGVLNTLEYLRKGGRIGRAAALAGSLLQIKPIVAISNGTAGEVSPAGKARTMVKALEQLDQLVAQGVKAGWDSALQRAAGDAGRLKLHMAVFHGDTLQLAEDVADRLQRAHQPVELVIAAFTPVVGVYSGPGIVGATFYVGVEPTQST